MIVLYGQCVRSGRDGRAKSKFNFEFDLTLTERLMSYVKLNDTGNTVSCNPKLFFFKFIYFYSFVNNIFTSPEYI